MADEVITRFELSLSAEAMPAFYPLLQRGCGFPVQVGCTLRELLCEQLGLDPVYVESRIQTIFLNGSPVDDLSTTPVPDCSEVALSAAMPGLAGAVLRRGGKLATMRQSISCRSGDLDSASTNGIIFIKVFNLLLKDLAAPLLQRGVQLAQPVWKNFLTQRPRSFWDKCQIICLNDKRMDPDSVAVIDWSLESDPVEIRCTCREVP